MTTRARWIALGLLFASASPLYGQGGYAFMQGVRFSVSTQTCASNGGGTAAALTVTVLQTYVALTQSDPDGCALTLSETGARDGMTLTIVNVSANSATIADSAGVQETNGGTTITLAQYAATSFIYRSDRWVQIGGSGSGGGAPSTATYITQTADGTLSAEQALASLSTGLMKVTTTTGAITTATEGTDYYKPTGTDVGVADGGTGLSSIGDDAVPVGSGATTMVATSLPSCSNSTTSKLLYNSGTNAFSCGTDQDSGSAASNYQTVQDEASDLTQRAKVNFAGAGVSCVDNSGASRTDCTISGGGGVTPEEHTASSSASLDFTAFISGSYDTYVCTLVNVLPATSTADLLIRLGTGGGPTWDTGANYTYAYFQASQIPNTASLGGSGGTSIKIAHSLGNTSTDGYSGKVQLFNPGSTSVHKLVRANGVDVDSSGNFLTSDASGRYSSTTAVTGIQFLMSSGNIASGTIRCQGEPK